MAAGGVVGSIAALLLAPKSGRDLRRDIVQKKDKVITDTNKQVKKARKQVMELYSTGRKKTGAIIEETKSKLNNLKQSTGDVINSGMEIISGESHRLKEAVKSGMEAYKEERKAVQH